MKSNILPLFAALAFALPFVTAQTTSAAEPRWGGADQGVQQGYEQTLPGEGGGSDVSLELSLGFCTAVQVMVSDRACGVMAADTCLAACNEAAVEPYCGAAIGDRAACVDDTVRACRSACGSEGATFCDARWGGKQPAIPGKLPAVPGGKLPAIPGKQPAIPGKLPAFPDQNPAYPDQGQGFFPEQQGVFPDQNPAYPDQLPAKPDHDEGGLIFVSVEECTALGLEINVEK